MIHTLGERSQCACTVAHRVRRVGDCCYNTSMHARRQRPRVVCVDDDPSILLLVKTVLVHALDVEVHTATSAAEARKLLAHGEPPALVLLDLMMPGFDGYAFCRELKASASLARVPVVFLSAMGIADADQVRAAGASDFIEKPFAARYLAERVRRWLEAAEGA